MIVITGALGTCLYLLNHFYISLWTNWNKTLYFSVNFTAASLLVFSSSLLHSWQAVSVNLFWAVVSLLLLMKFKLTRLYFPAIAFHAMMISLTLLIFVLWLTSVVFPISLVAWTGTVAFCFAYLLFVSEKISAKQYFSWNTIAALSLLPQLWLDQNWSVFVLEVSWASISLVGFIRRYNQVHLID